MKWRVSKDMLDDDLLNRRHENEWDRKTAEDLRDARVTLARLRDRAHALIDEIDNGDMTGIAFLQKTNALREVLEAVKHGKS